MSAQCPDSRRRRLNACTASLPQAATPPPTNTPSPLPPPSPSHACTAPRLTHTHPLSLLPSLTFHYTPQVLLSEDTGRGSALLSRLLCGLRCAGGGGGGGAAEAPQRQHGWQSGLVLQDSEVQEIRDILLVLIIAAEHYSLQHDGGEYTRLLTFCKRVCKFFHKCSDSGTDPFVDIRSACSTRIKSYKATRAMQSHMDFGVGVGGEPALEVAAAASGAAAGGSAVGPELSRAVLGLQRPYG